VKKERAISRSAGLMMVSALVLSILSCVAAIPLAVKYYKSANQITAKAETTVPTEEVYNTAVSIAEEKGIKILKKEDEKSYLEVTDGVQTASFKAEKTDKGTTAITITASIASEEPEEKRKGQEKELAHRIIGRICERLSAQCIVEKE
jgi:hypothetical protein